MVEIERVLAEGFLRDILPQRVSSIDYEIESDARQGEGKKNAAASKNFDFWFRLEFLVGLKLSGHTDT